MEINCFGPRFSFSFFSVFDLLSSLSPSGEWGNDKVLPILIYLVQSLMHLSKTDSLVLPLLLSFRGQLSAIFLFLVLSIFKTCPIHCHLLFFTIVLIFSIPALCLTSVFKIIFCPDVSNTLVEGSISDLFFSFCNLSGFTYIYRWISKASTWFFFQLDYCSILFLIYGMLFLHA